MIKTFFKLNAFVLASVTLLSGCLKAKDGLPKDILEENPTTLLEFVKPDNLSLGSSDADNVFSLSVNATPVQEEVVVALIRVATPDIPANGAQFTVVQDDALLEDAGLDPLPTSNYTWVTDLNNVMFNPNTRMAELKINLNKEGLDLSKAYGIALKFGDLKGNKANALADAIIVQVGVKNKYDGVYTVTGTMNDVVNPALTAAYPLTWELRTSGSSSVAVYDQDAGSQTHLILNAGAASQYGMFGLNVVFDPVTNKITSIVNSYGQPAANGRSAALDPTGINAYDPETKTIKIKYFLLQPGTNIRTTFDETWTYSGER